MSRAIASRGPYFEGCAPSGVYHPYFEGMAPPSVVRTCRKVRSSCCVRRFSCSGLGLGVGVG